MVRLQVELRDREQRHGDLCPATAIRPASGYADATRYLLNTLLAHKQARGLARRAEFTTATGQDVDAVLATLAARAEALEGVDQAAAATCVSRSTPRSPRTRPRWSRLATRRACSSPVPSPSTPGRSSTRAAPRRCSAA